MCTTRITACCLHFTRLAACFLAFRIDWNLYEQYYATYIPDAYFKPILQLSWTDITHRFKIKLMIFRFRDYFCDKSGTELQKGKFLQITPCHLSSQIF